MPSYRISCCMLVIICCAACSTFMEPREAAREPHSEQTEVFRHPPVEVVGKSQLIDGVRESDYFPSTAHSETFQTSSVLVLWEPIEEEFEFVHLRYSHDPEGPFLTAVLAAAELEEIEHPLHGKLLGHRMTDIDAALDLFVFIQVENKGNLSDPSDVMVLPAFAHEVDANL